MCSPSTCFQSFKSRNVLIICKRIMFCLAVPIRGRETYKVKLDFNVFLKFHRFYSLGLGGEACKIRERSRTAQERSVGRAAECIDE